MNPIRSILPKCKALTRGLVLTILLLAALAPRTMAQVDPHFSQYYVYPMALNPALTGAMAGDYRVSAIWRSQYNNALLTKGVSADVVTDKNTNFGFNLLNQSTNDNAYNFTNGYLTMSYTGVRFGPQAYHYLAMALQCGFLNRRFDVSKLQFGDQWLAGVGYDASLNSGEVFNKPSIYSFDAGAGIAYYDATPDKKVNLFGGFSAFHITRPDNPFLSGGAGQPLPVRYSLHAGARITLSDLLTIVPNALYMQQAQAQEKMFGTYAQIYVTSTTDIMIGANWRIQDAIVPFAGLYYNGMTLGLSYDVNASQLSNAASRANSFELSLSYVGKTKKQINSKAFYCPRF